MEKIKKIDFKSKKSDLNRKKSDFFDFLSKNHDFLHPWCPHSATVAGNKILKMTSCSHLKLFFHEFITVHITQMNFGTDIYIIVMKRCAFGLICNYLEN